MTLCLIPFCRGFVTIPVLQMNKPRFRFLTLIWNTRLTEGELGFAHSTLHPHARSTGVLPSLSSHSENAPARLLRRGWQRGQKGVGAQRTVNRSGVDFVRGLVLCQISPGWLSGPLLTQCGEEPMGMSLRITNIPEKGGRAAVGSQAAWVTSQGRDTECPSPPNGDTNCDLIVDLSED